ncbi:N-acetylmuramoyl-L-alanine amidase-like domain-containing protein [Rapidithrix thailandica]|uniref:N-acetylmuramoyl-L-alanine amidase-like domain-containing protein n=1 Tax=Rapidithrix thailandica TaxID=413964 RepID=A0AAW9RYL9_9BACT
MKKNLLLFFSFLFLQGILQAQPVCEAFDVEKCEGLLQKAKKEQWHTLPDGELVLKVGKVFLGTPYVAKTLEVVGDKENLVINLRGLDCTTYLENVLVFTRLIRQQKYSFEAFLKGLEQLRYREGDMREYPSRLHYFSEWLVDNEAEGIIQNISKEIGGKPYQKTFSFMTAHRDKYEQLANDAYFYELQKVEERLNQHDFYYLPKSEIASLEEKIQSGDLIAITTTIPNLDIVHVGFAYQKNGRLHFMHASSRSKKVEITQVPLAEYLGKIQSGIMVARLK